MDTQFVRASFDVDCEWQGIPPVYRIYINEELMTERTWKWTEHFLQEMLQLQLTPGDYNVRLEVLQPSLSKFTLTNHQITHGNAHWVQSDVLRVQEQ
jgi:hypothetical protein